MITALRWIKKPDGTKVLQFKPEPSQFQIDYGIDPRWEDVPTIVDSSSDDVRNEVKEQDNVDKHI